MKDNELEKLKYPIGKHQNPEAFTETYLKEQIETIEDFVSKLKNEVQDLNEQQLDTPYRPNGWTVRQTIHHCADSHMHCYIRIKWALTENEPTIKYYEEALWGEIVDNQTMPIAPTLQLLEGLHFRLVYLLKRLTKEDLQKTFIHPEHNKAFSIQEIISLYAWHGKHHLAHITTLKRSKKWL
ncbi:DinB superfamily protein [Flavobacterium succinicans]|uniref:DinB superfamily protein n=1 Tax=Flavobacterium succinicans TaxID=29536 RepID=A0A1I4VIE9_9FLAO|nr:putative metal-dependent hydrolase [Flavobacterium succinicans]SFN00907.1 DinB superfamily protein [Flavobacterium succinicans]